MTSETERRTVAARALVDRCPPGLGSEIAITGSVSKALADADSDIEINFWVDGPLDRAAIDTWVASLDVGEVLPDPGTEEDTRWLGFAWQETWIEAGWQSISEAERVIGQLLAAERIDHHGLMFGEVVTTALPLRSAGRLQLWKERLAHYPDALAEGLIDQQLAFWSYEHWMRSRWADLRRGQWLPHLRRLEDDLAGCLRIVFALNRRWEPDWKWLDHYLADLPVAPAQFSERIGAIALEPDTTRRVTALYALVLDTIALVPPSPRAAKAREVVERCLAARPV
jgi:hypothetical protein